MTIGITTLVILFVVFIWYLISQNSGSVAAWLDRTASNFAGGVSSNLLDWQNSSSLPTSFTQDLAGSVNKGLFDLTSWAGQWDLGENPATLSSNPGIAPYFGDSANG